MRIIPILLLFLVTILPLAAASLPCEVEIRETDPLVTATLTLDGGVADEPARLRGVTALTARLLADQLAEDLGGMAPRISFGHHAIHIEFMMLPERVNPLLAFIEQRTHNLPLDFHKLETARLQLAARVRLRRREPEGVLADLLRRTLWLNLPYRHPPEGYPATLAVCDAETVQQRLTTLQPDRIRLHLTGPVPVGVPCQSAVKQEPPEWPEAELDAIRESCERMNVSRMLAALAWPAGSQAGSPAVGRVSASLAAERLNRILVHDLKLVPEVDVSYEHTGGHAMLSLRWEVSEKSAYKVRENTLRSLTDLELGQFKDEELDQARSAAAARRAAQWGVDPVLFAAEARAGRMSSAAAEATAIQAVTRDEVMHFLRTAFARANHVYSYILPRDAASGKKR